MTEESHFRYEECPYPNSKLEDGEVLMRCCYLTIDPALRCTLNEDTGVDYVEPQRLNEAVLFGGLAIVEQSSHPSLAPGDWVLVPFGLPWALYFVVNFNQKEQENWQKIEQSIYGDDPIVPLWSMVALTSLVGLWEKGHITADKHQTLVVSGAAGACGSLAGQMGRLEGCSRVVGICGTDDKCQWLTRDLGFDGAINYKTDDVASRLNELCPDGVDVYFDNVGGDISDKVIAKMNPGSHVILCGQVSQYEKDVPYPPPIPEYTQQILKDKNITRERFLVLNYPERFPQALLQFIEWVKEGKLKLRVTIAEGLENAGVAFVSMMRGGNIGKQLVKVSNPVLSNL